MITRAPARAQATQALRWKSMVAGGVTGPCGRRGRLRSTALRRAAVRETTRAPCVSVPFPAEGLERGQPAGRRLRRARGPRRTAARLRALRAIEPPCPARCRPGLRARDLRGRDAPRVRMGAPVHVEKPA